MKWSVEILNEAVLAELEALPSELRARLTRIVELIEDFGLEQLRIGVQLNCFMCCE